jgi:septal ring factor EnvC (AmiA/AmiB activator)
MTERADKSPGSADSSQPGGDANVVCIPDAIVELRKDVRELRVAVFGTCTFLLAALAGGYLLLSAKSDGIQQALSAQSRNVDQKFEAVNQRFDAINQRLSDLSVVVARIDERTAIASTEADEP